MTVRTQIGNHGQAQNYMGGTKSIELLCHSIFSKIFSKVPVSLQALNIPKTYFY